jgi:hypothetical protein
VIVRKQEQYIGEGEKEKLTGEIEQERGRDETM